MTRPASNVIPCNQTAEEEAKWKEAAAKEGLPYQDFVRRAMNERAQNVLHPGSRLIGGVVEAAANLVKGKSVFGEDCKCGHSKSSHPTGGPGSAPGSCGRAACPCTRYRPGKTAEKKA